ncbi:HAD family hydrolase [bacterium]|nr:HAD family hydrolase [bacterium]
MKLIIFDLDGTLYDTKSSFTPAVGTFLSRYDRVVPPNEFLYKFIGEPMHRFNDWVKSLGIDDSLERLLSEFDGIELDAIRLDGHLYPGVIETLDRLKTGDLTMAICSNGPEWYITEIIDRFGLGDYLSIVKFPRSAAETKVEMVREIIDIVKPEESYLVGDRFHDLEAARRNDCVFIGASYGFGRNEIETADHLISTFTEIRDIVSN